MEKYLMIKSLGRDNYIELDTLKRYHAYFIVENYQTKSFINHNNMVSAMRLTDTLFKNENYILTWTQRNIENISDFIRNLEGLVIDNIIRIEIVQSDLPFANQSVEMNHCL